MSKYKKGDKFIIEIEDVADKGNFPYTIKDFSNIFSEDCFNTLERFDETKTYEQGLEDAWEIARKLCLDNDDKFSDDYIDAVFPSQSYYSVLKYFTAAEAIAKIKEYEEKQQEINVGDEIKTKVRNGQEITAIVYKISQCEERKLYYLWALDSVYVVNEKNKICKTGKYYPQMEELMRKMKEG